MDDKYKELSVKNEIINKNKTVTEKDNQDNSKISYRDENTVE